MDEASSNVVIAFFLHGVEFTLVFHIESWFLRSLRGELDAVGWGSKNYCNSNIAELAKLKGVPWSGGNLIFGRGKSLGFPPSLHIKHQILGSHVWLTSLYECFANLGLDQGWMNSALPLPLKQHRFRFFESVLYTR